MNRRRFILASSAAIGTPTALLGQERDKLKIDIGNAIITGSANGLGKVAIGKDFMVAIRGDLKWEVPLKDVTVAGLTVPKFSAGWVGLQLASGVLSGVGGVVFGAITQALFGGPSIAELLQQQLVAIEKIVRRVVREELRNNELQRAKAGLIAITDLMAEYANNPKNPSRLDTCTTESAFLVSRLETFEFLAYLETMSAAALRLAVLQEQTQRSKDEHTNFATLVAKMERYQARMERYIDEQTTPRTEDDEISEVYLGVEPGDVPRLKVGTAGFSGIEKWRAEQDKAAQEQLNKARQFETNSGSSGAMTYWVLSRNKTRERYDNFKWQAEEKTEKVHNWIVDWEALRSLVKAKTTVIGSEMLRQCKAAIKS